MSVTSPETQARQTLITVLQTEFAPEGFNVVSDRLHGSVGWNGTRIGVSPVQSVTMTRDNQVLMPELLVQFYGKWNKEINPDQQVDPAKIENFAERFRRALEDSDPRTTYVWFFRLRRINYPPDPTGNITRFEATVEAFGQNSALIETTG